MFYIVRFVPIFLFVLLFVGSGIYFSILGISGAFYQLSPLIAIIPAIALGWALYRGNTEEKMYAFLDGARDRNIITMCIIFLLAGAFSEVTKAIGSVDTTVNLALSLIPSQFLLIGLFLVAAFISTAIGTSMGTIATIAPIAAGLTQAGFSSSLAVATVVGGAMFGDNLSIISDTTIASIISQEADMKKKLKLNVKIALTASMITIVVLFYNSSNSAPIIANEYSLLLVTPYIILILLASFGINVFTALVSSIGFASIIGFISNNSYDLLFLSKNITKGFASMHEIMLLSLMVGGLSGLAGKDHKKLAYKLSAWIIAQHGGQKLAQLLIITIVSIFDILFANNTIAIIFSGKIAKDIAKKHEIPPHYSAAWLDIFSCVFQGLIPYGAQLLLASTIAGVSPLAVAPQVYYCYILGVIAILYIVFNKIKKE
ncbi:MAG: Na+/H+ antiporter NhaC family protein [Wolbachia endosymbiont of Xenopsylla cheopis]